MGIEPSDDGEIQGPVPERSISAISGLIFFPLFYIYLPMHCLEYQFVLSLLYLRVKAQFYYFVRLSYMVLDKETVIKIWLNLGLSHQSINHLFWHVTSRSSKTSAILNHTAMLTGVAQPEKIIVKERFFPINLSRIPVKQAPSKGLGWQINDLHETFHPWDHKPYCRFVPETKGME